MKMSSYWNNSHIFSSAYIKTVWYKTAQYVVYWYDTVSANIIKLVRSNFYIAAFNIIIDMAVKSCWSR